MTRVKVCGVTCVEDARLCERLGIDAIGVNLIPASKRVVTREQARAIAESVSLRVIAVVADLEESQLVELLSEPWLSCLQLHGHEPPELVAELAPRAYKALAIASAEDVDRLEGFAGDVLLSDARVPGQLGGTGQTFDWQLVRGLAARRRLLLAGGLTPDNVARAINGVSPWGVDVASGVERAGDPRRKDAAKLEGFVAAVRGARAW